jgi:CBS domain-containing protein
MSTTTPISHVMTTRIRTVEVNAPMSAVRHILAEGLFHHVPVVEGENLVGMISSRDLVQICRKISGADSSAAIDAKLDETTTIKEVMQPNLVVMRSDESVDRAFDLLGDGNIHSVLVIDEYEHLVGIVTNPDLLDYLFA